MTLPLINPELNLRLPLINSPPLDPSKPVHNILADNPRHLKYCGQRVHIVDHIGDDGHILVSGMVEEMAVYLEWVDAGLGEDLRGFQREVLE